MKKIVSVVLAVIMVAGLCTSMPAASAAVVKENYFVTSAKAEKSVKSLQKRLLLETGKISDDLMQKDEFEELVEYFDTIIAEISFILTEESLEIITGYLNEAKAVLQKEDATAAEMFFSIINISMSLSLDSEYNEAKNYLYYVIQQTQHLIDSADVAGMDPETVEELNDILYEAVALKDKADLTVEEVESLSRRVQNIINPAYIYTKEDLIENIDWASYFVESGEYTDEELIDVKQSIENAQQIVDKEDATAQEIEDAYMAIDDAVFALPYINTTKEELQDLIEEANNYFDEDLYYAEELEALKQAIDTAEQVIADNNATDEQIEDAYMDIYYAMWDIEYIYEYTVEDIQQLIDEALEYINSGEFTQDEIKSELEFAKSVIAKEDPLQKEIRKAYNNLNNAILSLLDSSKKSLEYILFYVENNYININENSDLYQLFTQESLDALIEVYESSKAVLEDISSTEEDYSNAYEELNNAINLLRIGKFDREAMLYQIIENYKIVIASDSYDSPSFDYEAMRGNILTAETIYLDETSTDKAIEDIVKLLISDYDAFESQEDVLYGDYNMDDKVNIRDATDIQKVILEYKDEADFDLKAGDVDGNGVINIRDATSIQKWILDYIDVFPVENQDQL